MTLPTRAGTSTPLAHAGTGTATHDVTSLNIPAGSWVILAVTLSNSTTSITAHPTGWRMLLPEGEQTFGSRRLAVYGRVWQPGDTTVSFTKSGTATSYSQLAWGTGSTSADQWIAGRVGVRAAGNAVAGQSEQAGTGTTSVAPAITTAAADTLAIALLWEATSATETDAQVNVTGATLWQHTLPAAAIERLTIGYIEQQAAGTAGPATATYPNAQTSNGAGLLVGIPGVTVEAPTGLPVQMADGREGHVQVATAGGMVTPARLEVVRAGFVDVAGVLAVSGATWAHRGGSQDWPEMSEYAYDQSATRGYGALEFSAQRTSDGVWVGVHDANLNRTSQTTGLPNVSAMTWAQVQAQQNSLNSAGRPRPYWRLVDFLDKWGRSHVLVLDPKNALSHNAEFLAVCDGIVPSGRLVWKYNGAGAEQTAAAAAARARGWSTWGYFYNTDVDAGTFAQYAPDAAWDLIGMNIGAAQSYWDAAVAVGKPVVGHIATSQAMYDTAVAKGAAAVQCGAVASIAPVRS